MSTRNLKAEVAKRVQRNRQNGGPPKGALRVARNALFLLRRGKGGSRAYDSLFEQGAEHDDEAVAALHWLYRHDDAARGVMDRRKRHVPPLVFEDVDEGQLSIH